MDMAGYKVSPSGWNGFFPVPMDVVDRHLKLAPPDAIRTLLYLLRHGTTCPDAKEIAVALGIDEISAGEALDYWVADGLLSSEETPEPVASKSVAASPVVPSPPETAAPVASPSSEPSAPAVVVKSGKMPGYSHTQIRDAFTAHPELRSLFASAEEIFAHPLSDAVINLLYGLFDWFELPVDVIVTVLRRCDGGGRLRPAAIKDEAENFYKHGAVTKEKAERYAAELDERDATVDETARLLRITDHTPYTRERKAFETWRYSYGFDRDVVAIALEVAQKNTESPAYSVDLLPYMQKVLSNWFKGGVRTAEEARAVAERKDASVPGGSRSAQGKKGSSSGKSHSYDLDAEAKLAMARFSGKEDRPEE